MSCRRSLQKTADDGFAIWRTPYSETELQSSGVELACEDRTESRGGRCLAGEACRRQRMTVLPYGGRHTARRSCEAAESSWHVRIGRRAERGRCLAGEACRRQRMTVLPYGGRHTARRSCEAAESSWHVRIGRRAERGRCLAGEACRRQRMTVLPYGGRHTARRSSKLR